MLIECRVLGKSDHVKQETSHPGPMTWAETLSKYLKDAASERLCLGSEGMERKEMKHQTQQGPLGKAVWTANSKGEAGNSSGTGGYREHPECQLQLEMAQVTRGRVIRCR